ncbi:nucleoside-diphosphate sugar epimerase/dehydratase [Sulfitobacter sp. AS92]|uniref:polysaccharide biosynthesis protein n=1 Tax=Sulfitobacter sp. AS92 TaxID=3135783 RepID=UPI00317DA8D4
MGIYGEWIPKFIAEGGADSLRLSNAAVARLTARNAFLKLAAQLRGNLRLYLLDVAAFAISAASAVILQNSSGSLATIAYEAAPFALFAATCGVLLLPFSMIYSIDARSFSLRDLKAVLRAVIATILATATMLLVFGILVPASTFLVQFLIAIPTICAVRIAARRNELHHKRPINEDDIRLPVLMIGSGATCDLFMRSLMQPDAHYRAVGIVDDARGREQLYFHGALILGSVREPDLVIESLRKCERPRRIFLTAPLTHFDSEGIEAILRWAARQSISVSRLPDLGETDAFGADWLSNKQCTINPDDILNRPQQVVEKSLLRNMIKGRRVLVTGAGGSIGSELARQIASFQPAELALIDSSEFNAYSVDLDLHRDFPEVQRRIYVASIRNVNRLDEIFKAHMPELVFNAAALKHVPMVERDPCEGVLTNVIGARNVADAARASGAIAMVQISTDKAVNTTNVMGATKRVAEFYCQAQDRITLETDQRTHFFVVRFGNVLGSSGSLIPLFQRQIAAGGPLTVTDARMERYFMTIGEAVQLTLLAAAQGLERRSTLGEILVLDMGKPVKIIDLAHRMIRLAGLQPGKDVQIDIIGLRPGEKLFEELFDAEEEMREGIVPGLHSAVPAAGVPIARLRAAMLRLEKAALACNEAEVRHCLSELVPGYTTLQDCDKMPTLATLKLPLLEMKVRRPPNPTYTTAGV